MFFNTAGAVSLVFIIFALSALFGSVGYTASETFEQQQVSADIDRLVPQAYANWTSTISTEVQAVGQTGGIAIPTTSNYSMCSSAAPACGLVGSVAFTDNDGGGPASDSISSFQHGTGVYCPQWSQSSRSATATLSVTNIDGSLLGTRNISFVTQLTCGSPYIASTTVTDDAGRALNADGYNRVGDTGNGCDPTAPANCDTLTGAQGAGAVADTREHAAIECAGIYCTPRDGLRSVDSFANAATSNGAESTGQPR